MSAPDMIVNVDAHKVTKSPRKSLAIAQSGSTTPLTFTLRGRGVITRYLLELPIMATTPTITLSLVDENSIIVFTGAAHTSSASALSNYSVSIDVEINGKYTVTLTPSGNSGTAATIYLSLLMRPN